jgi:hypothetical protein
MRFIFNPPLTCLAIAERLSRARTRRVMLNVHKQADLDLSGSKSDTMSMKEGNYGRVSLLWNWHNGPCAAQNHPEECPQGVKVRHGGKSAPLPLFSSKQTFANAIGTSVEGQKRK